ncbi:MAG: Asp-tRNA(Asn)/Glu-tRNA(Gln) amidotransferase subunit GatC [Candidatus Berkelbacteria bacterium]|nr:Asp-tRNA(Asn)/Glu-tRNA(Gln) amidotransferase subunit GatC [Candidatus Berkelbacteria bacterium]
MFSKEEVNNIAKLARLELSAKESEKFPKDLSEILDYFDKLKKADVADTTLASYPSLAQNAVRKDEVKSADSETKRKIMALAPETKDGWLKVKTIF